MADAVTYTSDDSLVVADAQGHAVVAPLEDEHVEPLHDATHAFGPLDRTFGKAVMIGYAGGFLVILVFLFITLEVMADVPIGAEVAAGIAVAFWMGILGGVVAVGQWASKHEDEIHHA